MKNRFIAVFICLLTMCTIYAFLPSSIKADSYSKISIQISELAEVSIQREIGTKIIDWAIDSGKIYLLTEKSLEIYDQSGKIERIEKLSEEFKQVLIGQEGLIYLLSKSNSNITILSEKGFHIINIPSEHNTKVYSMNLIHESILLDLSPGQSLLYREGVWKDYPDIFYVGQDNMGYFYDNGDLKFYDLEGMSKGSYFIPFELSPSYSVGIDKKGVWILFSEPLMEKSEDVDKLEFIYLDPKEQSYGIFSLPFGTYYLNDGLIYRLRDNFLMLQGEEREEITEDAKNVVLFVWSINTESRTTVK